jgi:hypothetical protein
VRDKSFGGLLYDRKTHREREREINVPRGQQFQPKNDNPKERKKKEKGTAELLAYSHPSL